MHVKHCGGVKRLVKILVSSGVLYLQQNAGKLSALHIYLQMRLVLPTFMQTLQQAPAV